ncbi:DUF397 domain-containing protein [Streptomyces sp. NPDC059255]|uniref:DUF397 domain-containing protein n=1 Tax=Streptomyces sp. NPDC059255 TaxID=3346793 RepID=UPI0036A37421
MNTEGSTDRPSHLAWFKSSYSGTDGGNCVEVAWAKSSYSGSGGGNCVEVALAPAAVLIRDSKTVPGPILNVAADQWSTFVAFTSTRRDTTA